MRAKMSASNNGTLKRWIQMLDKYLMHNDDRKTWIFGYVEIRSRTLRNGGVSNSTHFGNEIRTTWASAVEICLCTKCHINSSDFRELDVRGWSSSADEGTKLVDFQIPMSDWRRKWMVLSNDINDPPFVMRETLSTLKNLKLERSTIFSLFSLILVEGRIKLSVFRRYQNNIIFIITATLPTDENPTNEKKIDIARFDKRKNDAHTRKSTW